MVVYKKKLLLSDRDTQTTALCVTSFFVRADGEQSRQPVQFLVLIYNSTYYL